jgi:hypothetical protein
LKVLTCSNHEALRPAQTGCSIICFCLDLSQAVLHNSPR